METLHRIEVKSIVHQTDKDFDVLVQLDGVMCSVCCNLCIERFEITPPDPEIAYRGEEGSTFYVTSHTVFDMEGDSLDIQIPREQLNEFIKSHHENL